MILFVLKKVIEVEASSEAVFKAISDSNELTNWFPDAAILEPRMGGKFKFTFYGNSDRRRMKHDQDFFPDGKVLEFIQNKKLAYSWQHKNIPNFPETIVTWELEPIGKNKTRVTLTHSGFTGKEGDKGIKEHTEGWTFFLNELVRYCKKDQDGKRMKTFCLTIKNLRSVCKSLQKLDSKFYISKCIIL